MRTFGKFLGRAIMTLLLAVFALWWFGPYEDISLTPTFDAGQIGEDPEAYFADVESRFDDLTEGVEKRIVWRHADKARTRKVIVYVHGFSATSQEIRPVPDMVARALGANLVYTRLRGHGRSGAALVEGTVQDWMNDVAEALTVARMVGDEVIVLAISTGATLIAEAALQPDLIRNVKGVVLISPNFRLADPAAFALTLPAARYWLAHVAGKTQGWSPASEQHAKYWTTSYPTAALFQMAALVHHAGAADYENVTLPALFWFSPKDSVVDQSATEKVSDHWGGAVTVGKVVLTAAMIPTTT